MKQLHIRLLTAALLFACTSDVFAKKKKKCKTRCEKYDYVIVGGGTAGAALAAKLSDPDSKGKYKYSVCVLEAGIDLSDSSLVLVNNAFFAGAAVGNPKVSTVTDTYVSRVDLNPFAIFPYWAGIMWGGSSGHNYLAAVRGTPEDYNEWAAITGNDRWSYDNLLHNVMIPMEHYTPDGTVANPDQRGFEGPVFITQDRPLDQDPFMQAVAAGTGTNYVDDYNSFPGGRLGTSNLQYWTTPPIFGENSIRSYSGNSYLRGIESEGIPAIVDSEGFGLNGRKLKIVSRAHANRVIFSKCKHAKAVEYTLGEEHERVITVKARKGVVLCAGGIQDAAILQRSGIGDEELLNSLDIPVVYANSNVGDNLVTHYGPQAIFGNVNTTIAFPEIAQVMFGVAPQTNARIYQGLMNSGTAFFPPSIADVLGIPEEGTLGIHAFDLAPESRGNVEIVNKDPFRDPLVNLGLYTDTDEVDKARVIEFYNTIVPAIAAQAGATILYPTTDQYAGGDDALFRAGIDSLLISYHISSTCRMAQSAEDGVVDGELNVFGVTGLKVASNSVAPVIIRGNTGYSAYVIGLEAARIIRGEE